MMFFNGQCETVLVLAFRVNFDLPAKPDKSGLLNNGQAAWPLEQFPSGQLASAAPIFEAHSIFW